MSKFQDALTSALAEHSMPQAELAARCGTTQATISRVCSGSRPSSKLLHELCGPAWPNNITGLRILRAWLLDEVDRAGRADASQALVVAG
jgi:transcriptional regulator with XRE-family HTH domain